ncbi:MAG: hypothetical protein HY313_05925 [Acidobacteria bacterium]|nr:hypothetical protein [Acidobacteriota bacterium]
MRQAVIGLLLAIFGPIATLYLERKMSHADEWIWDCLAFLCVAAGAACVLLSNPIYSRMWGIKYSRIGSTAIIAVASAVLVGSAWWFVVPHRLPASTAPLPGGANTIRQELYAQFQIDVNRRMALYSEGLMKLLAIETNSALMKANVNLIQGTVQRLVDDHTKWVQRKGEADAQFAGLLARIRIHFPRSQHFDELIDVLSEPPGVAIASQPPIPKGAGGVEKMQGWAQGQADEFAAMVNEKIKNPATKLSEYMKKYI